MTLKSDANIKEKLTCGFKYDMWNLVTFHPTTQKFKNFFSIDYFCPKYIKFDLKKYRGSIFHDNEQWCKIWINPDLVTSTQKSEILHIYGLFLSKAYNVSARKFQRDDVSRHWKVMQNLKKNSLVTSKIT